MGKPWVGKFIGRLPTRREQFVAHIQLLRELNKMDRAFLKVAPIGVGWDLGDGIVKRDATIKSALRTLYEEPLMNREWAE